jgi:cyclophilin family peptidyl-prolyl cis-trans isomerase
MLRTLLCLLLATSLMAVDHPQAVISTNHGDITVELFADQTPETVANFLGLATGEKTWTHPRSGEPSNDPYYEGLTFHRVIDGFMIQGGCPLGTGTGDPGYQFADEINASSLGLDEQSIFVNGQPEIRMYGRELQQLIMPKLQRQGLMDPAKRQELQQAFFQEAQSYKDWSVKRLYEAIGYRYREDLPESTGMLRGTLAMANSGPNTNGSQFFINLVDNEYLTGKHTVFAKVIDGMAVVDAIAKVPTGAQNKPSKPVVIESIQPVE